MGSSNIHQSYCNNALSSSCYNENTNVPSFRDESANYIQRRRSIAKKIIEAMNFNYIATVDKGNTLNVKDKTNIMNEDKNKLLELKPGYKNVFCDKSEEKIKDETYSIMDYKLLE